MSDGTKKPVIFISYSHRDRSWLEYVRSFFEPLAEHWTLQIWNDEKLRIGDDWRGDIYAALDASSIFILLVSRYALASDFIRNEEVARILQRPKGEVQFCPIVVTPYHARPLAWLDQPNRRPKDGKALSEFQDAERDREMATIAGQIDKILDSMAERAAEIQPRSPVLPLARPAFPSIVDYGRLPEMPYKTLVGRAAELEQLDDAWVDEKTRIISLVAWGGAGKTSLVIEWLLQLRNDGYRNANAVLCWSFYSQGTTERAASGEGFLDWALAKLKVKVDTTSSTAKGEQLAEEMSRRRVLLVLDGVEPLQYGPEEQQGALKDQGLLAFLRSLAVKQPSAGHSLVLLTSRLAVQDLRKWQTSTAPVIDLGRLSDEAGAALLEDGGVKGTPEALREAAHDFAGHALALSLLAGFLRLLHGGDASKRNRIRAFMNDPTDSKHDQARRVIEAYDIDWLAHEPHLRAIMNLVGLFDRPATADCVGALRGKPVIDGLTNEIADLSEDGWRAAVARLRDVRLLDPEDPSAPDGLDAHPLVREWFGERLKQTNETAWKAAHSRLYEHLRDMTEEGDMPTLEGLAPLYQAIAHGCQAGRHQDALHEIYIERICRRDDKGNLKFYSRKMLGAFGSNLAAISWFFSELYDVPISSLTNNERSWVLGQAAMTLGGQGRFTEALPVRRAGLQMREEAGDWADATASASNLSEAELLFGDVSAAIAAAERSVTFSDRDGGEFWLVLARTTLADAMHAAGQRERAETLFAEAEQRQRARSFDLLYSLRGYQYCDLILAKGELASARDRAELTLKVFNEEYDLLSRALDLLTLGRACLGLALRDVGQMRLAEFDSDNLCQAQSRLDQSVDGLLASGQRDDLPRGLLARAIFYRNIGDWNGAARDLDYVEEIAEPGPMRLHLCDLAMERARLTFAKIEAFAPLNGLLESGSPKPAIPEPSETASLKAQCEKQLRIALNYVETCGYHRRDEELAELEAVLRGERKFADLPARV